MHQFITHKRHDAQSNQYLLCGINPNIYNPHNIALHRFPIGTKKVKTPRYVISPFPPLSPLARRRSFRWCIIIGSSPLIRARGLLKLNSTLLSSIRRRAVVAVIAVIIVARIALLSVVTLVGVEFVACVIGVDVLRWRRAARDVGISTLRVRCVWWSRSGKETRPVERPLTTGTTRARISTGQHQEHEEEEEDNSSC